VPSPTFSPDGLIFIAREWEKERERERVATAAT
jgi:hypothetical protein